MPGLATDAALFALRLMMAAMFGSSGWSHLTRPGERADSIGMSEGFTLGLGVVEVVAAASLALGAWPQIGALALSVVMLGAIRKKMFVWKTGLWGEKGHGWYYELLYLVCNLVILATGGGSWRIT